MNFNKLWSPWKPVDVQLGTISENVRIGDCYQCSLRAGSLVVWAAEPQPRAGKASEKNGARKSEPARELLIFEFPVFADERSDPIG